MRVLLLSLFAVALGAAPTNALATIKPGDKLPWADLHFGFPPQLVNTAMYAANKNMLIIGLPGAFTPTCSSVQVPGYLENQDALRDAGIDEVLIYCVNDGAVMRAWGINQKVEGSIITLMGDPEGEFTKVLGMELTDPVPRSKGLIGRSKRFALLVVKNIVKYVAVSEAPGDPAGDDDPSATCHEAMLKAAQQVLVEATT